MISSLLSPMFLFTSIRLMTPLLYATIAVSITILAGNINIALEGIMLASAFVGVVVSAYTGSLFLSMVSGIVVGLLIAAILAYFYLRLNAHVVVAGIAMNMLISGVTVFLLSFIAGEKGSSSSLKSLTFPTVEIRVLEGIPVLGTIINGHNVLTYFALLSVFIFHFMLYRMPVGLRIRAVGQNPDSANSVGISVARIRLYSFLISGFFGSLGGMYLSMGYVSWFTKDMTAGRGFIAIAASELANSLPFGSFLAALLFGVVNAIAIYLSSLQIPSEFVQSIPYVAAVVVLTVNSARIFKKRRVEIRR